MNNFSEAMKNVMESLTKEERKKVISNSIVFKKKLRKGTTYYELGCFGEEPTAPEKHVLNRYIKNKRKINYIYAYDDTHSITIEHYVNDYFWGGKKVVKTKEVADKIYSKMMELYNASKEWQEHHEIEMNMDY